MIDSSLLLPVQSLLIHIGPHKTGTSSLQSAFHAARPKLEAFGVRYAGAERRPARAIYALTGRPPRRGEPPPSMFHWDRLVGEITDATEDRVVLSSESFADGDETIPHLVYDTFRQRDPHLVVTLRPLSAILPSQWQQYVQNGLTIRYSRWLEQTFDQPDHSLSQRFWHRHDHGALVERWVEAFGPGNCTVVVSDGTDRQMLLRAFEAMVGLPAGLLVPEPGSQNRSLTYGEVELHRRLNIAFKENGWSEVEYAKLVRHGMVANLQLNYQPGKKAAALQTPGWAVERAAAAGAASAAAIRRLGVKVVGDLDALSLAVHTAGDDVEQPPPTLPMRAITEAVLGVIIGSQTAAPIEIYQASYVPPSLLKRVIRRLKRLRSAPDSAA